jgi:hypothetical protein
MEKKIAPSKQHKKNAFWTSRVAATSWLDF